MRDREDVDYEFVYEDASNAARILGIEFERLQGGTPDIRWSGFWSQGDGASFVGSYDYTPDAPAKIRAEYPTETTLHKIADGLAAEQLTYRLLTGHRLGARVTQLGNYYHHEMTMGIAVLDCETGDEPEDAEIDERLLDLMRDFARWIYKRLEREYEYRMSDEAIDECILNSDYRFDEDGNQELREEIVSLLMHRAAQHESLAKNTVTARCRHEFTYAAHVLGDLDKAAMTLVRLLNDTDFSKFDTETAIDLTGEVHRLINRLEGTYQPRGKQRPLHPQSRTRSNPSPRLAYYSYIGGLKMDGEIDRHGMVEQRH
ncbi:unnamed protein product [Sphagnum balticum]